MQNNQISQFGLMEISRQRRRAGVLQATSAKCNACDGTGLRRSIPSAALQLLRAIEARAANQTLKGLAVTAPTEVALYILNSKREALTAIEETAGFTIEIHSEADMLPGSFTLKGEKAESSRRRRKKLKRSDYLEGDPDDHLLPLEEEEDTDETSSDAGDTDRSELDDTEDENSQKRKRRRRGRRGGRRRRREDMAEAIPPTDGGALLDGLALSISNLMGDDPDDLPAAETGGLQADLVLAPCHMPAPAQTAETEESDIKTIEDTTEDKPKRKRRRRRRRSASDTPPSSGAPEADGETDGETELQATDNSETLSAASAEDKTDQTISEPAPMQEVVAAAHDLPQPAQQAFKPDNAEALSVASEEVADLSSAVPEPVLETPAPRKKRRGWWSR